jgi:hypothetical protein
MGLFLQRSAWLVLLGLSLGFSDDILHEVTGHFFVM